MRAVSASVKSAIILLAIIFLYRDISAEPIPLYDHSFRSFEGGSGSRHYQLLTPPISELWYVNNLTLQFSDRFYLSDDTALVSNRWMLHFADSLGFHGLDFNFRIRLDGPGHRVRDAGWTSEKAGEANDPGFVYDADRIVAHYTTPSGRFKFGFGKDRYNWGPLELGGLLLSDYNEGFTGFYQQYQLGTFVLRGLTAQINSLNGPEGITHRYFSASRLEYYKRDYGAAVGQSILYAGLNRSWDLRYFLPFYIFHYGQMTDSHGYGNAGQNSQGSIDGYWKVCKLPFEVYGELLIDDFQAHGDEKSKSIQNNIAWMIGLRLRDAGPWYGFIEGGRVSTYTYNHRTPAKRYVYNDNMIGSPLGPDQELLWGQLGRAFYLRDEFLRTDLNFWLRRSGERGIDYRFFDVFGTKGDPQPYGIVEDELSLWASASYRKFFVDVEARSGLTMYRNRGNEMSEWVAYPFFGLFLSSGVVVRAER